MRNDDSGDPKAAGLAVGATPAGAGQIGPDEVGAVVDVVALLAAEAAADHFIHRFTVTSSGIALSTRIASISSKNAMMRPRA